MPLLSLVRDSKALSLPWCPLGPYAGPLSQLLLKLRQPSQGKALAALVQLLSDRCTLPETAVLVTMPSWKRQRSNPLPQRSALGLGRPTAELLHRTRAGSTALAAHQALEATGHGVAGLI